MKKLSPMLATVASAVALLAAMPAVAQERSSAMEGPYIGLQGGYLWNRDMGVNAGTASNEISFKDGWTGVLEGGYRLGNGLSLGVESGFARNSVKEITGGPTGRTGDFGRVDAITVMGVANYEFDTNSALRPYVGAGAGLARLHFDNVGDLSVPGLRYNDWDSAFAWQVGAGFNYAVAPNVDLSVGYRYLDTTPVTMKEAGQRAKFDYNNHALLIGARYTFGAETPAPQATTVVAPPPPPPPPAPAAAPAPAPTISRNFTVFFDFDQSTLSADAQSVLQNVARDAKAGNIVAINVSGHADTSGSQEYNERLSRRRAEAVREYLMSQGLGTAQIQVEAKGETDLLVPTADGVREPSNRRAVIVFPQGGPNS